MDPVHLIQTAPFVDMAIFALFCVAFILGVLQGAVRRILGILSILIAFLLAANLRNTFGDFLAGNWTQFPAGYDYMLAFAILFGVFAVVASIVIQGFYKRTDIYARRPIVDDLLGGALGLLEALLVLTIAIIIFSSYTLPPTFQGDLAILHQIKDQLINVSSIAAVIRDHVVPGFVSLFSGLLPGDVVAQFR